MKTGWRQHRLGPAIASLIVYGAAIAAAWMIVEAGPAATPIGHALIADIAATCIVFAAGWLTRNSSLYDPYWSVAPPLLALYWFLEIRDAALSPRELLVLGLVTLWAVRLTFNCMRRWQSFDEEDFRYQDLRARFGRWYPLVDLFGIELFPTLLVFLGCLPLLAVAAADAALGWLDLAAATVTLGAILLETVADEQMWAYRKTRTPDRPICTRGVWRWSQHPNYVGEILFWWGLWLFGLASGAQPTWMIAGAIAMTLLFVLVSIPMMVRRKRERYPDYDSLTAGIPVLLPRLF